MDWNPSLYLKFHAERTQPSIDLVSRIELENPQYIIDLGCGPGNSTEILFQRWPGAKITGLDSSGNMIEKARHDFPKHTWIQADASSYSPKDKYDLVFSNAVLQWIPEHQKLVPSIFSWLKPGGIMAVQVPANAESALHLSMIRVARTEKWRNYTSHCESLIVYHSPEFYYNLLQGIASKLVIWETIYYHVLASHQALIDWYRSTGMRTYLESLPNDASRKEFENEVLSEVISMYPVQEDNKVIYPFRRLFFMATKNN